MLANYLASIASIFVSIFAFLAFLAFLQPSPQGDGFRFQKMSLYVQIIPDSQKPMYQIAFLTVFLFLPLHECVKGSRDFKHSHGSSQGGVKTGCLRE